MSWVGGHPFPYLVQSIGGRSPYLVDTRLTVTVQCAGLHMLGNQALGVQDVQCQAFFLRPQTLKGRGCGLWTEDGTMRSLAFPSEHPPQPCLDIWLQ